MAKGQEKFDVKYIIQIEETMRKPVPERLNLYSEIWRDKSFSNGVDYYINRMYATFGMTEYKPVHNNMEKDVLRNAAFEGMVKGLEKFDSKSFFEKKQESNSNAQSLFFYLVPFIKHELATAFLEEAQLTFPKVTRHYQEQLINIKKAGCQLDDSPLLIYQKVYEKKRKEAERRNKDVPRISVTPTTVENLREVFKITPPTDPRKGYDEEEMMHKLSLADIKSAAEKCFQTKSEKDFFTAWFNEAYEKRGKVTKKTLPENPYKGLKKSEALEKQRKMLVTVLEEEQLLEKGAYEIETYKRKTKNNCVPFEMKISVAA